MQPDLTRSPDHEQHVLAALYQYPMAFDEFPELTEEHFSSGPHRLFYRSARQLWERNPNSDSLDFASLAQVLRVGLGDAVAEIMPIFETTPDPDHLEVQVEALRHQLARRKALEVSVALEDAARTQTHVSGMLEALGEPVSKLQDEIAGAKREATTKQVLAECVDEWEQRALGKKAAEGIRTSIPSINRFFKGLHPGHLVIIGGYPGGGKTVLGAQFVIDAAMADEAGAIYSLEMTRLQMVERVLPYVSSMPALVINDPLAWARQNGKDGLTKADIQKVKRGVETMVAKPIEIQSAIGQNVVQIVSRIRARHRREPLKVVLVDFIQRMPAAPAFARESREQQISHAINMLADTAKDLGICMIVPSQLSKDGATKHAESINEAADLTLVILQDPQTKEHKGITVQKDRHFGHSGQLLNVVLDHERLRFIEQDDRPEPSTHYQTR